MKFIKTVKILIFLIILVSFSTSLPLSEYYIPQRAASIFSCDVNGDNHNDLIVGHLAESDTNVAISLLENTGNGLFTLYDTSNIFNGYENALFATLINNDNYPDIIAEYADKSTGIWQFYIRILYNDGNGKFPTYKDFHHTAPEVFNGITSGDYDGDQHQDIAVIVNYYDQSCWGVFYNDGNGNLLPPVYYNLSFFPQDVQSGDLNNDGKDDVVIVGDNTELFFSTNSGFQTQLLNAPLTMMAHIADMNHDGNKDIIGMNGLWGQTSIYMYDGNQNYSLISQKQLLFASYQSVVSDLNNDSLPDLLILPNSDNGIYILYNTGNFTFDSMQFIPVANFGENRRFISCSDLDGNGFNDISMVKDFGLTGATFPNLIILYNDGLGHFLPDPVTKIPEKIFPQENSFTNYPNPFHDQTTFDILLEKTSMVNLTVYNANGYFIRILMDHTLKEGHYTVSWNGTDSEGLFCKPGVYIAYLIINEKCVITTKCLIF